MARDELAAASDLLESAAESASDADDEERIEGLVEKLDTFATGERGPDHGQLARVQNALTDLEDSTEGETPDTVAEAHDHVRTYREGVEGV